MLDSLIDEKNELMKKSVLALPDQREDEDEEEDEQYVMLNA